MEALEYLTRIFSPPCSRSCLLGLLIFYKACTCSEVLASFQVLDELCVSGLNEWCKEQMCAQRNSAKGGEFIYWLLKASCNNANIIMLLLLWILALFFYVECL